jgi:peptidoglycan/LPS O-acetylase OafA/YrhL
MELLSAQRNSSSVKTVDLLDIKSVEDRKISKITNQSEFRLGYRPSLDGLRALCILVIMLYHARQTLIPGGKLSLSVFFILSGFLITALLMQEWNRTGRISFKQFYLRRALRILPALFALLFVCCLYALTQPKNDAIDTYKSVAATLFYVANWYIAFDMGDLGPLTHTWSLSVEEQFYTILPIFLGLILWLKLKKGWMLFFLLFGITVAVTHTAMLWEGEHSIRRIHFGTDARIDQFLIGCLVGVLASWNFLPKTPRATFFCKISAVISVILIIYLGLTLHETDPFMSRGATTLVAAASAVVIINLISSPVGLLNRFLEMRFLVWVGRISYGLYLWHFPIFRQVMALGLHPALTLIIEVGITFIVAILSYHFIEKPFLRLKKRFGKTIAPPG